MHVLEHIISAIAPHRCLVCNTEGYILCDLCCDQLKKPLDCCYKCAARTEIGVCCTCKSSTPLSQATSVTLYEGLAKDLIHRLKFDRTPAAARPIARLMLHTCPTRPYTLVTHAPTATRRIRQRGYDQAALIAKQLAHLANLPYQPLLARSGQQRQVGQARKNRQEQLRQAFRIVRHPPGYIENIILVDDVLTTGSTMESAALTLKTVTTANVYALVFATA